MQLNEHWSVAGTALKRWLIGQTYDALAVGLLWLLGLLLLDVPFALLWALLAVFFQYIPVIGGLLALLGPAATAAIARGMQPMLYVLILYALIVLLDGFLLQPYFMRRTARVPMWASILAPLILGSLFSFWGVVLAVPLLVLLYAYKHGRTASGTTDP